MSRPVSIGKPFRCLSFSFRVFSYFVRFPYVFVLTCMYCSRDIYKKINVNTMLTKFCFGCLRAETERKVINLELELLFNEETYLQAVFIVSNFLEDLINLKLEKAKSNASQLQSPTCHSVCTYTTIQSPNQPFLKKSGRKTHRSSLTTTGKHVTGVAATSTHILVQTCS